MDNRNVIIDVNNVFKSFRVYYDKGSMLKEQFVNPGRSRYEEREILKGISFKVFQGETVALIGQNGCGKSTTLKMLTKILYPNKGTVTVNGKVSSLIELGAGFHPDMSGRENIYINGAVLGLSRTEVDKRVEEIIRFSELEEFIDNPIRTYSSGMYMRLAFSVAINVDADILLIDEILAVGDQAFQEKCIRKLDELRASGVTVVLVSHSMGQIKEIADRCIWIENGQIREDGDTETVCNHYEDVMTRRREARDEVEEEQRRLEAERLAAASQAEGGQSGGNVADNTGNSDSGLSDKQRKKAERERRLQERQKRQEAFSARWQGGGVQGKPVAAIAMIMLMILHACCADVFMIGLENVADSGIVPVFESSLLTKILGYLFWCLGRVGMPMMLILLGFEVLPGDYSTSAKRLEYYRKVFLPVFVTWEIWVIVYQVFLHFWDGRGFEVSRWIREALLIKYVDLGHAWIFRFVMLFLLIAPYVSLILKAFNVGLLRFLFIIVWVLIFLFPGLDYYGQANGGDMSFPQSLGTFCYFFYFCLGFLISRYMQRIFKGSKEVVFFVLSLVLTVWSQLFLDSKGIEYLVKASYFGVSLMALFGVDLLLRFKVEDMFPKAARLVGETGKCVKGMYFIYVPAELLFNRYLFKAWELQGKSGAGAPVGVMIGMWIATTVVTLAVVYGVRKIIGIRKK